MNTTRTLASALALTILLVPLSAAANDASESVQVPSLQVKERIRSIEQINVTAEKEAQAVEPESDKVAALLREAAELEEQDEAAQSTTH